MLQQKYAVSMSPYTNHNLDTINFLANHTVTTFIMLPIIPPYLPSTESTRWTSSHLDLDGTWRDPTCSQLRINHSIVHFVKHDSLRAVYRSQRCWCNIWQSSRSAGFMAFFCWFLSALIISNHSFNLRVSKKKWNLCLIQKKQLWNAWNVVIGKYLKLYISITISAAFTSSYHTPNSSNLVESELQSFCNALQSRRTFMFVAPQGHSQIRRKDRGEKSFATPLESFII